MERKFSFEFSGNTLTYGIYLAAKFETKDLMTDYLVIYVFVNTLTDSYVTSLQATFNFNFTCSFGGKDLQCNGSPQDTAPFWTSDVNMYSYYIYSTEFTKNIIPTQMTIEIEYHLTSSRFDVVGVINHSSFRSAFSDIDMIFFIVLLVVVSVIVVVSTFFARRIIRKRRSMSAWDDSDSKDKIKWKDDDYEIDYTPVPSMSDLDTSTYNQLQEMYIPQIIQFLKDSQKEVEDNESRKEISAWIKRLKKYKGIHLSEDDLRRLTEKFTKW